MTGRLKKVGNISFGQKTWAEWLKEPPKEGENDGKENS